MRRPRRQQMTDKPMLRKGDEGPYVRELQEDLNTQNAAGLVVDADFGSLTDSAVRNYQGSRGLDVDGICGPDTWGALDSGLAPLPPPPGLPPVLSSAAIADIEDIAATS